MPVSRPPDTTDKEGVTRHQFVAGQKTHGIEVVPRRKQGRNGEIAQAEFGAMVEWDIGIGRGLFVGCEFGVALAKHVVAGHVVVVPVGVENIGHVIAQLLDTRCELIRVVAGIDYRTLPACFISNEIAEVAVTTGVNLFKNHLAHLLSNDIPLSPACQTH